MRSTRARSSEVALRPGPVLPAQRAEDALRQQEEVTDVDPRRASQREPAIDLLVAVLRAAALPVDDGRARPPHEPSQRGQGVVAGHLRVERLVERAASRVVARPPEAVDEQLRCGGDARSGVG